MLYLLVILVIGALVYTGWRMTRSQTNRTQPRVIGPDDDPDFLWRLNHGDNKPR